MLEIAYCASFIHYKCGHIQKEMYDSQEKENEAKEALGGDFP